MTTILNIICLFISFRYSLGYDDNTALRDSSNKTIKLVKIIKEDLRKNNDDYADALALKANAKNIQNTTIKTTRPIADSVNNINNKYDENDKAFVENLRRAYDMKMYNIDNNTIDSNDTVNSATNKQVYRRKNIVSKITKNLYQSVITDTNKANTAKSHKMKSSNSKDLLNKAQKRPVFKQNQYTKNVNIVKQTHNFKNFLENNKNKIKQLVNNDRRSAKTYPENTDLGFSLSDSGEDESKTEKDKAPAFKARSDSEDIKNFRASLNMEGNQVPNSEQLDMAHAKGGRVYKMRIKGRLCHRHVLVPEGPKYDSKGVIYLSAFSPKGRREYEQTKAPAVLLPRCCNCCKKSVLGCE